MIKAWFFALILSLGFVTPAQAYSPPPAGNILLYFQPRVQIMLPPRLIMTPAKLSFPTANQVYTFNEGTGQFEPRSGLLLGHRIDVSLTGSGSGAFYTINIYGFKLSELPQLKNLRLTFKEPVSKNNIELLENYLTSSTVATARLTGAGCVGTTGSHICLDTITRVRVLARQLPDAHLRQTIPVKGIFVGGNAASPTGSIQNLIISSGSVAIGGNIQNVTGGQTLTYNAQPNSQINWLNVEPILRDLYAKRNFASPNTSLGSSYSGSNWYLNAATSDPSNPVKTSFSSPPEGKLWNIVVPGNTLTLGPGNDSELVFHGGGTIVVSSASGTPVDVIFTGKISCEGQARLGLVTEGHITFRTPSDNKIAIGCGAYTSLQGNINFEDNQAPAVISGEATGAFIAKGDINLPATNSLQSVFEISPDTIFLTNPTILYRELLKAVFSTGG